MTRKLRRDAAFEISIEIRDESFIRPPRDAQRQWLLNRVVREVEDDLRALDVVASRFVPGSVPDRRSDRSQAELSDQEIMEDWQLPLMREMAAIAARSGGDVLEVGFGRGVSASLIQDHGVRSHTVIECNDHVVERFETWRRGYPGRDIRLVHGLWQDRIDELGRFDAVFFHTYVLDEEEAAEYLSRSVTFAEHFFPYAREHLVGGGVFTYLSNEIDSLSRAHQRRLLRHFSALRAYIVPLELPDDVQDAWWADSMMVVEATR